MHFRGRSRGAESLGTIFNLVLKFPDVILFLFVTLIASYGCNHSTYVLGGWKKVIWQKYKSHKIAPTISHSWWPRGARKLNGDLIRHETYSVYCIVGGSWSGIKGDPSKPQAISQWCSPPSNVTPVQSYPSHVGVTTAGYSCGIRKTIMVLLHGCTFPPAWPLRTN